MTYQKISGTLSANAHGSYSTQDALGDLLVTDVLHRQRTSTTDIFARKSGNAELYARSASRNFEVRKNKSGLGRITDKFYAHGKQCRGGQRMPDKDNFNAVITPEERKEDMDNDYVVRRLTPLECERLQGFPSLLTVKFSEMTKDEYIAYNIAEGNIIVDTENGKVYGTRGPGGTKLAEPKELKGSTLENGYLVVTIVNGETRKQCRLHRIVWIAANGVLPDGYVIDHINNDKTDNRLANLQLLTPAENSTKARSDGLYKVHETAGRAKIDDETHDLIRYAYENTEMTLRQLSEVFGISKSRVQQIVHEQGWTNIPGASDTARYKALGNSIALPQWQIITDNMAKYLPDGATLGSLFDGIGGFPLCWERTHGKGTAIWASEIERFPIEVTKYHFGCEEENIKGDIEKYLERPQF